MVTLLAALQNVAPVTPVQIPEPTDLALFALAIAGLVIGRQSSRKRPADRDPDA